MSSAAPSLAKPTLWRTCRVLANTTRLRMLRHLISHPGKAVTEMARALKVPKAVASQYLRALNARGLLNARREGKWVYYSATGDKSVPASSLLLDAILQTFKAEKESVEMIFRLVTAFTHPRREKIYCALQGGGGQSLEQLRKKTGISRHALRRHLNKLQRRGFVRKSKETFECDIPDNPLAKVLARLVLSGAN